MLLFYIFLDFWGGAEEGRCILARALSCGRYFLGEFRGDPENVYASTSKRLAGYAVFTEVAEDVVGRFGGE